VQGDICAPCCGSEREVSVSCPLNCEFLLEARRHEKIDSIDPAEMPNRDVEVTEEFLNEHDPLLAFLSEAVLGCALRTEGAVDADVREALAAIIKTYRTRQSGLIYETRPANPIAANVQKLLTERIEELQKALTEQTGMTTLRDAEFLGIFVFLHRIALHWDNRRPRGRSFLSFLLARQAQMVDQVQQQRQQQEQQSPPQAQTSSIILP
jgi:hypothetical protein